MENASHALYMVLAVFSFILAWTYSLYLIGIVNSTASTIVNRVDETSYYDSLSLRELVDTEGTGSKAYKEVGIESIIPTLYRYDKESFCVKIVDTDGTLLQIFDTTVEGDVNTATARLSSQRTDREKALLSLYGDSKSVDLFGAPWVGSTEHTKERVDAYISGKKMYINNTLVDYKTNNNNLQKYSNDTFKEIFSVYSYEGDTISSYYYDEDGNITEIDETLTGNKQTSDKIIITYQLLGN